MENTRLFIFALMSIKSYECVVQMLFCWYWNNEKGIILLQFITSILFFIADYYQIIHIFRHLTWVIVLCLPHRSVQSIDGPVVHRCSRVTSSFKWTSRLLTQRRGMVSKYTVSALLCSQVRRWGMVSKYNVSFTLLSGKEVGDGLKIHHGSFTLLSGKEAGDGHKVHCVSFTLLSGKELGDGLKIYCVSFTLLSCKEGGGWSQSTLCQLYSAFR